MHTSQSYCFCSILRELSPHPLNVLPLWKTSDYFCLQNDMSSLCKIEGNTGTLGMAIPGHNPSSTTGVSSWESLSFLFLLVKWGKRRICLTWWLWESMRYNMWPAQERLPVQPSASLRAHHQWEKEFRYRVERRCHRGTKHRWSENDKVCAPHVSLWTHGGGWEGSLECCFKGLILSPRQLAFHRK